MTIEKPIPFGSEYIMKPGMTYRDICIGMRLDESEMEAGILALELLNGPEPVINDDEMELDIPASLNMNYTVSKHG